MADKATKLDALRRDKGASPELRAAEREVNDCLDSLGLPRELSAKLLDFVGIAIVEAVKRAIQEVPGSVEQDQRTDRVGRRQSAFVHDEQRLADSLAAGKRENDPWVQRGQSDHRGRGFSR